MNKKILFIVVLVFSLFLMPKVKALSFDYMVYYDSSFNVLQQFTTTSSNANVNNVKYLRCRYTDDLSQNSYYNGSWTYSVTGVGSWPYSSWNGSSGINLNGQYYLTSPSSGTELQATQQGANSYFRQVLYNFNNFQYVGATGTKSMFFQIELTNVQRITYFSCDSATLSISSSGGGGGTTTNDTQQIINNQNSNTQNIINNQNSNTQNIINSQQETTDAIEDLNDTIQDTTIDDNALGGKLAEITSISDTPITDLLTLPVTLLQKLYTSLSGSCSTYSIPFGFGLTDYTLNLPCLNLGHEKYLGRVVWGAIDDLICILMVFAIFKMVIWFYSSWTTLKDNFMYLIDPSNGGLF